MMMKRPDKVTVWFEQRPGGGLRAWSDDVPGLVLSHSDIGLVLADLIDALGVILSERFGEEIRVQPGPIRFLPWKPLSPSFTDDTAEDGGTSPKWTAWLPLCETKK
jgi:hypothetical protein